MRMELAVKLCVAGVLLHHATNAAFQTYFRDFFNRKVIIGIIVNTNDQVKQDPFGNGVIYSYRARIMMKLIMPTTNYLHLRIFSRSRRYAS
ncbi:hypothetical protein CL673_01115 [Candidatus Bathyarchaeota archaeon]|nr:hypothetical protein [Candidatus Bathyarchaeota archaeon]